MDNEDIRVNLAIIAESIKHLEKDFCDHKIDHKEINKLYQERFDKKNEEIITTFHISDSTREKLDEFIESTEKNFKNIENRLYKIDSKIEDLENSREKRIFSILQSIVAGLLLFLFILDKVGWL